MQNGIPGDFIEAGVWRGGATIYMRAVLKNRGVEDRTVWVADSFQGVPSPDPRYRADAKDILHCWSNLAVSQNGGYVIVDDYGEIPACRPAVEDFRRIQKICDPIVEIDHTGIYWIKTASVEN